MGGFTVFFIFGRFVTLYRGVSLRFNAVGWFQYCIFSFCTCQFSLKSESSQLAKFLKYVIIMGFVLECNAVGHYNSF